MSDDIDHEGLWDAVVKTLTPLPGRTPKPQNVSAKKAKTAAPTKTPSAVKMSPKDVGAMAVPKVPLKELDAHMERRLLSGKMRIERKIDLHGMTQAEAFDALQACVDGCYSAGKRLLLVVTGKGRGGDGVLRAQLPRWLHQGGMQAKVLAFRQAEAKHGGAGAWYVILRKKKV